MSWLRDGVLKWLQGQQLRSTHNYYKYMYVVHIADLDCREHSISLKLKTSSTTCNLLYVICTVIVCFNWIKWNLLYMGWLLKKPVEVSQLKEMLGGKWRPRCPVEWSWEVHWRERDCLVLSSTSSRLSRHQAISELPHWSKQLKTIIL